VNKTDQVVLNAAVVEGEGEATTDPESPLLVCHKQPTLQSGTSLWWSVHQSEPTI